MAIHVTPIPSTIELAAPAFTLGTANTSGAAATAISSNSTLLTFDGTTPATVAASAVVGSATVAARRDHVHIGVPALATIASGAYNDANISVANATTAVLALNEDAYLTDDMHDKSTNNSRMKATTAGTYVILGSVRWASNGTGRRLLYLRYNGSGSGETVEVDTNQSGAHFMQVTGQHVFTADQYVELLVYQTSGGALDCETNGTVMPGLSMMKVLA